ncbi:MAG: ABC transporter ATP-binding protein/permease [Actinomycetota bacterium]|nr:ABC transporter ATP-binding protein/permease [Actinomycetota bacterium]
MESLDQPTDFSTLTRRLQPERGRLVALGSVLVAAMTLPLLGPWLMGRFVDLAADGEPASTLVLLAGAFLAVALVADGLQLLVTWLSVRLAWRVGNRLRADLCEHALGLDLGWHGEHSAGQLIERVDGDVDALTKFSSTAVLNLAGNAVLLLGTLVVVTAIDWRAGALIALVTAIAAAVLARLRKAAVPARDEEREIQGQLYGDIEERLGGLEDLRANGAGRWAVHRLHVNSYKWWHVARKAAWRGDGALVAADVIFAIGSALVLGLGLVLYRADTITLGTVLALFRYSQLVSEPLWEVAEQLSEMQKAVAGTRRAARLLATESAIRDGEGVPLPDGPLAFELDDVSFGYGTGRAVLDGVSITAPAGATVGVVGRTGSGKTTIGRLLARLWDPESGAVRVGGLDLRDTRQRDLRRRIAVVTQEVEIFRGTLRDNVTMFGTYEAPDGEVVESLRRVGLGRWFSTLPDGLDAHLDGPSELSAGEAQLLAFARVLLADPGLVVLDEASSRLDPASEARLAASTEELLGGRTAVVIAHRLSTLESVDLIVMLDGGRVVEQGMRAALVAEPESRYARLLASERRARTTA